MISIKLNDRASYFVTSEFNYLYFNRQIAKPCFISLLVRRAAPAYSANITKGWIWPDTFTCWSLQQKLSYSIITWVIHEGNGFAWCIFDTPADLRFTSAGQGGHKVNTKSFTAYSYQKILNLIYLQTTVTIFKLYKKVIASNNFCYKCAFGAVIHQV